MTVTFVLPLALGVDIEVEVEVEVEVGWPLAPLEGGSGLWAAA